MSHHDFGLFVESECWGRVKCNSVPHKLRLLGRDAAFFQEFASRIRAVYLEAIRPVVPLGQTEIVQDRGYSQELSVRCYRGALCKDDCEQPRALKKPNNHRKYEAVLNRFGEFFRNGVSIDAISGDDLTRFVVTLKKDHGLGSNTILHNAVIVAQFLKRHGRSGITKELPLPERITPLVKIYRHEELARFFAACSDRERALFATFLLTGFREQEVMFLRWSDVNFELRTVRVTSKPELGFYPKRWEDREIPAPVELIEELRKHTHRPNCQFVFPSPKGNREQHMLDHCKSIAKRAKLDPTKFDLKTFRSTYATGMLRRGFDVRTVQHWMAHKSLETTMLYLAPATDVHDELDLVTIPSVGKADPAPRKSVARDPFSSEGRTIACPRRRAGSRRRAKTRYLSIPSLCA